MSAGPGVNLEHHQMWHQNYKKKKKVNKEQLSLAHGVFFLPPFSSDKAERPKSYDLNTREELDLWKLNVVRKHSSVRPGVSPEGAIKVK